MPEDLARDHREHLLPSRAHARQQGRWKLKFFNPKSFYWLEPEMFKSSSDLFNVAIPPIEISQDALLLPLLVSEKTCRVMLYHTKGLGPNFRPSRMWQNSGKKDTSGPRTGKKIPSRCEWLQSQATSCRGDKCLSQVLSWVFIVIFFLRAVLVIIFYVGSQLSYSVGFSRV